MLKRITLFILSLTIVFTLVGCKGKKATVTFDSNGGSTVETQEIKKGELATKPADPTKEGFKFIGWFNGEQQWNFDADKVNENITLTAKWEEEIVYKVSFILSGGTLEEEFIEFTDYTKVVLPTPEKENYVFLGWYKGSTKYEALKENSDITLTAKWEGVSSPIVYNLNGGEFTGTFKDSYKYGTAYTLPIPTKEGYNFKGWYKNENLTGTALTKIDNKTIGEVVLYAKWEAKPPMVTYELNGGNWQWTSREAIVDEFLNDALAWAGKTNKPNGMVQGTGETSVGFANVFSSIYGIFSDSKYADKWGWLKTYIIEATTVSASKTYLEQGNEVYWRYSLGAFLFKECRSNYPISEDFSKDAAANGFWDTLSKSEPNQYEITAGETLKTPVRIYFIFDGWYEDANFSGEKVTSVTKSCTLYAKWLEETPVSSISISNKITEIDRYETHQLEWLINPVDAAIKSVVFTTSDKNVATVSEEGLITAVADGTVTITIQSLSPSGVTDSFTLKVSSPAHFDTSYASKSYTTVGQSISLVAEYINRDYTTENLVWSSLNSNIATVTNDGVVTGVKEGTATIRVTLENDVNTYFDFVVNVISTDLSAELQFIVNQHNSNVFTRYNLGIGAGVPVYYDDIIGGVSKYLFEDYVVHTDYYIEDPYCRTSFKEAGVEFITVHYAADMTGSATKGGENLATFNVSKNTTAHDASWHYGVGNDGIWACQSEAWGAWHAGSSKTMTWTKTGIKYSPSDPKYATVTLESDNYFYLNGINTGIKNTTTSTRLNQMGLAYRVVNGEYELGGHYYNSTYNFISSTGGNQNSIGMETSCAKGSDQWLTWQYTAQLCAKLLIKYDLEITRVVGHHFFSGKDCPQQLLENDMEIWWEFMDMVEAEYIAYSDFSTTKFDFTVLSGSEILDVNGRITSQPKYNTVVTYRVTLGDGTSIELSTMVPGIYNK